MQTKLCGVATGQVSAAATDGHHGLYFWQTLVNKNRCWIPIMACKLAPAYDSEKILNCFHVGEPVGDLNSTIHQSWPVWARRTRICKFLFLVLTYHHVTCIHKVTCKHFTAKDCGWRSAYATKRVKVSYSSHYARYHYRIQLILKPALSRTRMSSKHQARRSTPEGDRLKQHLARLYVDKLTCSDPVPLFHVGMSRYALRSKLP